MAAGERPLTDYDALAREMEIELPAAHGLAPMPRYDELSPKPTRRLLIDLEGDDDRVEPIIVDQSNRDANLATGAITDGSETQVDGADTRTIVFGHLDIYAAVRRFERDVLGGYGIDERDVPPPPATPDMTGARVAWTERFFTNPDGTRGHEIIRPDTTVPPEKQY